VRAVAATEEEGVVAFRRTRTTTASRTKKGEVCGGRGGGSLKCCGE
jgi:hypothetical protein